VDIKIEGTGWWHTFQNAQRWMLSPLCLPHQFLSCRVTKRMWLFLLFLFVNRILSLFNRFRNKSKKLGNKKSTFLPLHQFRLHGLQHSIALFGDSSLIFHQNRRVLITNNDYWELKTLLFLILSIFNMKISLKMMNLCLMRAPILNFRNSDEQKLMHLWLICLLAIAYLLFHCFFDLLAISSATWRCGLDRAVNQSTLNDSWLSWTVIRLFSRINLELCIKWVKIFMTLLLLDMTQSI
jgi:hypothetical protein